jgi:hypothetical protein
MLRKLIVIPCAMMLIAFMSLSTLTSCEKDPASPSDTLTFTQLNEPYVSLTPTVATTQTSTVTFFARSFAMNNSFGQINIFVDGIYINTITGTTSSGVTPSCNSFGNATTTLTAGVHTWFATTANSSQVYGTQSNPRSVNITTVSCNRVEVL